ncbi:MAG: TonB-dependent receptor plug domain-containing protein [Gemmatimonadaceae bacterium]|nr:TonB-dependent receptor plug domain-containing protein [Gemmatimonadaceae bacterium]
MNHFHHGALLALVAFGVGVGTLRAQGVVVSRPAGVSVSGIVMDSLASAPLRSATVQLVNADSLSGIAPTVDTDSLGHFFFADVRPGRYIVGFLHPILDSLGIEPTPREVIVDGRSAVWIDLALPSTMTLRRTLCGAEAVADSDAVIMGFARNADDRTAVDSAVVSVQWVEILLERGSMNRSIARRAVATQQTGWYAVCGAPSGGSILLSAAHGTDSTETLELDVPTNGYIRRDLYFGTSRVAGADSSAPVDSLGEGPARSGDGRLSGTVIAAKGGRALAGARVGILNGPQTRADERGAWTLTGLPTGTRTLQVRAVAHYPVSMPVDVVDGAAPVRVSMVTLESVLDTVRVTARRNGSSRALDFMDRKRRAGTGRFITSDDVAARNPVYTTDLFRSILGVSVVRTSNGDEALVMRGNGLRAQCRASVFLNGMSLNDVSASDINGFVRPNDIIGIEVYSATGAPPQYSRQNGCGSVLIWSR